MAARQCPYCGKMISVVHTQCPFCREAVPPVPGSQGTMYVATSSRAGAAAGDGNRKIRQGLLYMLLAGVIQYLLGGYGAPVLRVPIHVLPAVTVYLAPMLFLCGLGLSIYGFFLHARA
jgi:ribosomal protein L24E